MFSNINKVNINLDIDDYYPSQFLYASNDEELKLVFRASGYKAKNCYYNVHVNGVYYSRPESLPLYVGDWIGWTQTSNYNSRDDLYFYTAEYIIQQLDNYLIQLKNVTSHELLNKKEL